jgi:hypothetical protein
MSAEQLVAMYPNETAVLSVFTNYHWAFKTKGPFTINDHYYIGNTEYPIDTELTIDMLNEGIAYFNSHLRDGYNSMENYSIQNALTSLQRLCEILDGN